MDEEQRPSTQESAAKLLKSQMTKVFGDSGTARYGGYFQEEPNSLWRDDSRIDIIYRMRNEDAVIAAIMSAIRSPILSTEWRVESTEENKKGEEIRKFIESDIFNFSDRSWTDFVREALGYIEFGFYTFEQIYEIRDGYIHLKDLAPRIPSSVQNWQGPKKEKGITQWIRTDEFDKSQAFIPIQKLFVLTNDKEGDDITGRSIFRASYIHWKLKNTMYRIQGISSERYGVGTPVATLSETFDDAQKDALEEMVKNVRSNEKNYMVLLPGQKFEIITPNGNPQEGMMTNAIKEHNTMMLMSVLAQFLMLGSNGEGSNALSSDHSSLFIQYVTQKAQYFVDQFNKQVIERLVDLNFGKQKWYPTLRFLPLGNKNMVDSANILSTLMSSGLLTKDVKLEQHVRQLFKYPELTDEEVEEVEAKDEKMPEDEPIEEEKPDEALAERGRFFRVLTEQEERADMYALAEEFDTAEAELEQSLTDIEKAAIAAYIISLRKKIESDDVSGIADITTGTSDKMRKELAKAIKRAYDAGKTGASREVGVERPSTPVDESRIMTIDADDIARNIQNEVDANTRDVVKDAIIAGASTAAIISAAQFRAKDVASKYIANTVGSVVGQYLNRGRMTVFQKNLDKIVGFQRSEVLDSVTCNTCLSLDKKVVKPDDPMAYLGKVHSNCRGEWMPILTTDNSKPKVTGIPRTVTDSFTLVDGRPTINSFKQLKAPIKPSDKAKEIIKQKLNA